MHIFVVVVRFTFPTQYYYYVLIITDRVSISIRVVELVVFGVGWEGFRPD
jgi:hypothetical protein